MALDFAQMDATGRVTGLTVRLDPRSHLSIIHGLPEGEYPLLSRMRDYYDDAAFGVGELTALEKELIKCSARALAEHERALLNGMLSLVRDSFAKGLAIEAIAD